MVLVVFGSRVSPSTLPLWLCACCGSVGVVLGTGLRVWAILTLGRWFDRNAAIHPGQRLVTAGPYRLLKHPAYVANVVFVAGVGLAVTSVPVAALLVIMTAVAHMPRIRAEERSLISLRRIAAPGHTTPPH